MKHSKAGARSPGKRYPLLIYRRYMDRLWLATFLLGIILGSIWLWRWYGGSPLLENLNDAWLLAGAIFFLAFSLFAFLTRSMAYVQPYPDHLRLVTPFLRLNISYRRIRSAHPAAFQQIFPPRDASWAQRRFLEPFYPKTAVVIDLTSYPMSPFLLHLFLAPQMFSPRSMGFVLVVPDWMELSTELDSHLGVWSQSLGMQRTAARTRRSRR